MAKKRRKLGEILVESGVAKQADVDKALKFAGYPGLNRDVIQ